MEFFNYQVLICSGEGCNSGEAKKILNLLKVELKQHGLDRDVEIIKTGCIGLCNLGPSIIVYPGSIVYANVKASDIQELVAEHFIKGKPLQRLVYQLKPGDGRIRALNNLDMYKKQERIVLRNCGIINPEDVEEYIARDGYKALGKVLTEMKPEEVIDVIKESGLRGRGGGGFPTGTKWAFASKQKNDEKYIICNADEGDPGAFMDRSVLEGDPHTVLEAMAIGGYAIGANKGFIYVRAEYPLAVERLKIAIAQAKEYGVLGERVFGSDFNFDIEIRLGAGAFVCGEETALIKSIEGKRGMPVTKPPFPAVSGLWGKPTVINNVETFANICPIILKGAEWFKSIGTEKSSGTKVFALGGKIRNTGLVEIAMGTPLREIIFDIGGGIPNNKQFKAVQTGGPSGGCIPARALNIPIEYDSLIELGSMMGSGGMIVMDEDNCMVDIARFFLDFTKDESCGKCTSCRIGTKRMLEILEKITSGKASMSDVERLEKLARQVKNTALCGLGQTAPNPILSTLRYFKDEYIAHVVDKKCPAKACKTLVKYRIKPELCRKCGLCAKNCGVSAIHGKAGVGFDIDITKCIRCGVCKQVCAFNAIVKE
ncbi:NADH-quinone oxidoreductase subunit NuoF [Clostridium bovifaecis]|uniref:NADH-quinone oxidoreductase subunit NuoF n=1 Tax=Clostridium bovifaecis TaxID=2184719 RepID=A0A6I6F122_9CLOT|nr:NADH-quinone oxidoreductase subunit NuoF [Clostridium bovifaecis]